MFRQPSSRPFRPLTEIRLSERWFNLASRIARPLDRTVAQAIFNDLEARYGAPDRHYHDRRHIAACLELLDSVRHLANDPDAIELAIWFHDAVYDTRRQDNEEASARLADAALQRLGIAPSVRQRVYDLVLATRHSAPPSDSDSALLLDMDLSTLGQPAALFDTYEAAIRREYAWVPETDFRMGRTKLLRSFLAREPIYSTPYFRDQFETMARENLTRSIAKLGAV